MPDRWDRLTRVDEQRAEMMKVYAAETDDVIILVREAAHRIAADNLRSVDIVHVLKDRRIEIRVRR